MDRLELFISVVNDMLSNKRKRHIIGGVLLSASLFFGGLALTAITIKTEEKYE